MKEQSKKKKKKNKQQTSATFSAKSGLRVGRVVVDHAGLLDRATDQNWSSGARLLEGGGGGGEGGWFNHLRLDHQREELTDKLETIFFY